MQNDIFINLAGVENCDDEIIKELLQAGIHIIPVENSKSEVPYSVCGVLGEKKAKISRKKIPAKEELSKHFNFVFSRAWYYWVMFGLVPLEVAKILYDDPVGQKRVRVNGHCGCPPPDEKREDDSYIWAHSFNDKKGGENMAIFSYHIDSQAGLNLFVRTLEKHKLI